MKYRKNVLIIDKFYDDPDSVVKNIIDGGFELGYSIGYNNRKSGSDRWLISNKKYKDEFIRIRFEEILNKQIDKLCWDSDNINQHGRFICKLSSTGIHFHNHDNISRGYKDDNDVGYDGWTAIVFMNKKNPTEQGLWTVIPDDINNIKFRTNDINKYPDNLMLDKDYCKKDTFIGNVYNRCVLIRGNIFHSGTDGCGDIIEEGRIIQTFFFKLKGENK